MWHKTGNRFRIVESDHGQHVENLQPLTRRGQMQPNYTTPLSTLLFSPIYTPKNKACAGAGAVELAEGVRQEKSTTLTWQCR